MRSLSNVLDLGREKVIKKIYWPSSIAVFGPTTPQIMTPQYTIMDPNTVCTVLANKLVSVGANTTLINLVLMFVVFVILD